MKAYRLYCFDGASRITAAEWVEAINDAEAISVAKKNNNGVRCEVWDRDRLVGRIASHQLEQAPPAIAKPQA